MRNEKDRPGRAESLLSGLKNSNVEKRHNHQLAFLAIREDVFEAIDAGYSRTAIWQYLKQNNTIDCQYRTFLRHIKKYRSTAAQIPTKAAIQTAPQKASDKKEAPESISTKGFTLNHNLTNEEMF